jgi:hypothetical protein
MTVSQFRLRITIILLTIWTCLLFFTGCSPVGNSRAIPESPAATIPTVSNAPNVFDEYLRADYPPADGFDFPFGNIDGKGSYIDKATGKEHPAGWWHRFSWLDSGVGK